MNLKKAKEENKLEEFIEQEQKRLDDLNRGQGDEELLKKTIEKSISTQQTSPQDSPES